MSLTARRPRGRLVLRAVACLLPGLLLGTVVASASSAASATTPPEQTACESVGGTYVPHLMVWQCDSHYASGDDQIKAKAALLAALSPLCTEKVSLVAGVVPDDGAVDLVATCRWADAMSMSASCKNAEHAFGASVGNDYFTCTTTKADPELATTISSRCADLGGTYRGLTAVSPPMWLYTCSAAV
jgi:hypothetical protein